MKILKRKLTVVLTMIPLIAACTNLSHRKHDPQRRFRGMGCVLVIDAMRDVEVFGLEFYDDRGSEIYGKAVQNLRNQSMFALGGIYVPVTVRATWREGRGWDDQKKIWNEGVIIGDYTFPVAERIPDEVLNDIREHGGNLRLKFRVQSDGVLFGWDIERALPIPNCNTREVLTCMATHLFSPGGDFKEAYISRGKVVEKGWYIDKQTGQKIETDY
ncbi:hypothetical protein ACO0K7_14760 [Undibacterium sp. Ji67W]|uniref:hypothetical protein n=1 Tax=Undibacterium sp. Ji67W TaxID=3413042 RepID=UPI003BF0DA42